MAGPTTRTITAALLLALACTSRGAPAGGARDDRPASSPAGRPNDAAVVVAQPSEAGWKPIDISTLDPEWRALLDACLTEKRKDGQDVDHYRLVETKRVSEIRYLYFTPEPPPDGTISSDHFGCRFDADGTVHVLYEG